MSESRWHWVRQPRWAILLFLIAMMIGWCLWPVVLCEIVGRTRGIGIVLPNSSESQGGSVSMSPHFEGPWKTRERVEAGAWERVTDLGELANWVTRPTPRGPNRRVLTWSRSNLTFELAAERLEGHEPGSEAWVALCEEYARDIDRQCVEGNVDGHEIRRHWRPRAWIWGRMWWDQRQRLEGKRPDGWWKDW